VGAGPSSLCLGVSVKISGGKKGIWRSNCRESKPLSLIYSSGPQVSSRSAHKIP
jgi:hypothetical protein